MSTDILAYEPGTRARTYVVWIWAEQRSRWLMEGTTTDHVEMQEMVEQAKHLGYQTKVDTVALNVPGAPK